MAFNATQKLSSMRYKNFTWDFNPASCTYSCQRSYVAHKYPELSGVELEDMDTNEIVITGKGEFFGPNAYSNWLRLNAEFKTFGPGSFYHPIFTDVTQGLMTKLQAEMEPRDDYIVYSFEIVSDMTIPDINTPSVIPEQSPVNPDPDTRTIKVGDIVILTGYAYYTSYGATPRSAYINGVRYTVTYTNYNGTHPIHCGSTGWCRLEDVVLVTAVSTGGTGGTGGTTYIVRAGESLSQICSYYGADWRQVAAYNGIKDPNKIAVGQKIIIPPHLKNTLPTRNPNVSGNKPQSTSSIPKISGGDIHQVSMVN